jgi:hypothetical protein
MIKVFVEGGDTQLARKRAIRKERYLYGLWNQRPFSMKDVINRIAWYVPLMGDCFLGAFPDLDNNLIRPIVRSPEYAYPVPSYDGQSLDAVMFSWETTRTKAARQFKKYDPDNKGRFNVRRKNRSEKVKVLEYSDGKEFSRWVDDQKVSGVEHNYGFNLFDQIPFINIPDEPWNHGAVEQAVSLNEAENLMRSLLLQAVIENIFPKYVLIDPSKSPEELDMGPGAVWGVNAGGDVKTITPPLQALPIQQAFLEDNERAMKQATSMPGVNFGEGVKGAVISGKAVNELQGAGTGSVVQMVQGLGIGTGLVSWNEKALCMGRKMFADDTMNLSGIEIDGVSINPVHFSLSVKGKDLGGSYRNEVHFLPHMDDHEKLVMGLQGLGANLWSKEYVRNQLGIPDTQAMDEEILGERLQDIVVGAIEQELLAAPTPEAAQTATERGLAYLSGETMPTSLPSAGAPPPPVPGAAPPGAAPTGGGMPVANFPGGPGQFAAPALPLPEGAPAPGGPAPAPEAAPAAEQVAAPEGVVSLDQAVQAIQALPVTGRVFLVGEIVDGQTDDVVEIAVTEASDKQVIVDSAPFDVSFTTVTGEPRERFVEVTPGAVPEPQGDELDLDAILSEA